MKVRYSRVYRHHWKKKPYTYVRSKQGKTIKGLQNKKLVSYVQGSMQKFQDFTGIINILSVENILYTEVSLQSFRMTLTRLLGRKYIKANWAYQICKHTNIILRQHKLPQGGSVDRISLGMRLAYGVPFARAAPSKKGDILMTLKYNEKVCNRAVIKGLIFKASSKLAKKVIIK